MENMGITMPAFMNRFTVKFINIRDGSSLEHLPMQIVKTVDGAGEVSISGELSITVELDCRLLALTDIIKLKSNAKDYIMLICVIDSGSDIGGALVYENVKIASDPIKGLTWDYAQIGTQRIEITLRYETRRVLTSEPMGTLQQILKTPA